MARAGDQIDAKRGGWEFDENVVSTFDEHVSKSVPGYSVGHEIVCGLTDYFVSNGSSVYEIGCSTGALLNKIAKTCEGKREVSFVGIDISEPMITAAEANFGTSSLPGNNAMRFEVADISEFELNRASMIVCYYTMQFIQPAIRQNIFNKIYESLDWGGAFVLFEKVRGSDARFQDILTGLYHDYKMRAGYSPEEVVAKSQSLRGVMEPFSSQGNRDLLSRAGFVDVETIYKNICFEGFLSVK
jgi:tRNA (cmo5U34)-methyltransferase